METSTIDEVCGLNYRSYLLSTKVSVNHMIEEGIKGRICFISSTRGIRAYPDNVVYGSLKAALNRAVRSLAIEGDDQGITVNAVAPGTTAKRNMDSPEALKKGHVSDLVPLKRKGEPDDVASVVDFLVSDDAAYITEETIRVDGGLILYGPDEHPDKG